MQFELFHSIGRIDSLTPRPSDQTTFREFFRQCREGEAMGFDTMWVAESHFSSEVQKRHKSPVIPNYHGEVGLNADSCQLAQMIFVGGNGGPIGAADRVRSLAFLNSLQNDPRKLHIGVAAGRFPYINAPFGIVPRDEVEAELWPQVQRIIFLEALEIFLRLSRGETISSDQLTKWALDQRFFRSSEDWDAVRTKLGSSCAYRQRWQFEPLKLIPEMSPAEMPWLNFVLGSHDPMARDLALQFADMDMFNLSFTPPDELARVHAEMFERYKEGGKTWHRGRMPRTVLVFIDEDPKRAYMHASHCFDTYIEAMRGTVVLPPKDVLMSRALIGTPDMIVDALHPDDPHGFHRDDRLMLWFEFNQVDHNAIIQQMKLFAEQVAPRVTR